MNVCKDKRHHATEREALDHLRWAKKQPGGKGLRDLCVYQCACGNWCVGRAWRGLKERLAAQPKPEPLPKPLTAGQLRRKAEREAREAEHQAMYADWRDTLRHVARIVDAEIRKMEEARRSEFYHSRTKGLGLPLADPKPLQQPPNVLFNSSPFTAGNLTVPKAAAHDWKRGFKAADSP